MHIKHVYTLILLLILIIAACTNTTTAGSNMSADKVNTMNPIFKLTVIDIPGGGIVTKLTGEALLLKKGTDNYIYLSENDRISYDDILELHKETKVRIHFKNGSFVDLESTNETKWFTFDK